MSVSIPEQPAMPRYMARQNKIFVF
uniref:Uncharacterized protein n=1 Tax=Arundo donax TaxID=35708 RepID=A0A0A8ZR94_ARUDO